jgi:Spy/CpxP family protein refolding chaperone
LKDLGDPNEANYKMPAARFIVVMAVAPLVAGLGAFATASPTPPSDNAPHRSSPHLPRASHLLEALRLTPAQRTEIDRLIEDQRRQLQTIQQNPDASSGDRHQQMDEVRRNTATQMRSILTADQRDRLRSALSEMRSRRPGPHRKRDR